MIKICKEDLRKKIRTSKIHKGPLMKNRRDNRNTRTTKMFRFTQRSFQQNRLVTINRILYGTLSLENEDDVYSDIKEVKDMYVDRLEKAKAALSKLITLLSTTIPMVELLTEKSKKHLKELKETLPQDQINADSKTLKDLSTKEVSAIFNKWWSSGIPEEAVKCRTTLLPKSVKEREQVGNWRPTTIGNLLIRTYGRTQDKRLRQHITTSERQKGFVPVGGRFENVNILKSIINNQRKK